MFLLVRPLLRHNLFGELDEEGTMARGHLGVAVRSEITVNERSLFLSSNNFSSTSVLVWSKLVVLFRQ